VTTIEQLAAELDAAHVVPAAWRAAFLDVARHRFLPPQVWVDDDEGRPQPLSRDDDSGQWRQAAYRNVPILIQFDDGKTKVAGRRW
jgi:protein-L-isoaspartate O-methyltransferase